MPFSPSDFEWWGWLLIAVGCAVAMWVLGAIGNSFDQKLQKFPAYIFFIGAVVGAIGCIGSFLLALVRFVKWAWSG
jgi:hypothetical protein